MIAEGSNIEGVPTMMGLDSLEMTKSRVWPPL